MGRYLFTFLLAYLIGAIPFGFCIYWLYEKKDIRKTGSGNIGATNIARSMGLLKGGLILLADIMKGTAAVYFALQLLPDTRWAGLTGLMAIIGHIFPVYLGFRGGKGVATWIGAFILLAPVNVLISLTAFLAVVAITRFVSLGSMMAVALFPLILLITKAEDYLWVPAVLAAVLVIFRHRDNIKKIILKKEHKFGSDKNRIKTKAYR